MRRDELVKRIAAAQNRRRGDHELNPGLHHGGPLTPAAVLVPLLDRPAGFSVLLTKRTEHLRDHSGQISFPGGRIEADDLSPEAAALREAEEEVGLAPELIEVLGRLDTYETRTGFEVTPVVGLIDPPERYRIDEFEVAEVFEVPLAFILDPANHERHDRIYRGQVRRFYVLPYSDRYIWGATAGMLVNLYEVLVGQ